MFECRVCTYWTYFEGEIIEHEQFSHPYCHSCECVFRTNDGLRAHHIKSFFHNYCAICDRHFQSPAALRGHNETHEKRDIMCSKCNRGFPSASAWMKHVEQGKCFGQHTQQQFVKKVRDWETKTGNSNLFTVPRLTYGDDSASYGPVRATAAAYNGYRFECYFCPREFGTLVSLNQHLNSGAHFTSKEFRCKKCGFAATWLSGVIAHIESEKCGFLKRSQVRDMASPFAALRISN